MPTTLLLTLAPTEPVSLRLHEWPAHGWFLKLAEFAEVGRGELLHQPNARRDFTTSPLLVPQPGGGSLQVLRGPRGGAEEWAALRPGDAVTVCAALADDDWADRLCAWMREHDAADLPVLGGAPCCLERVPDPRDLASAKARRVTWEALTLPPALPSPTDRLRVWFNTPVVSKTQRYGESETDPLPSWERTARSWADAWTRWAPEPWTDALPQDAAEVLAAALRLEAFELATSVMPPLKGIRRRGSVGWMEFVFRRAAQRDVTLRRIVTSLTALAPFCGTGANTAFGLGQTHTEWLHAERRGAG